MMSQVGHNVHNVRPRLLMIVEKAQFIAIGLYRDVWIAAIASSTTSLATRTAAICVCFQGRVYVTMRITFLTRKSALIYIRGLRQRFASLTLNCNGDFDRYKECYSLTLDTHVQYDRIYLTQEAHPRPSSVFWDRFDWVDCRHLTDSPW